MVNKPCQKSRRAVLKRGVGLGASAAVIPSVSRASEPAGDWETVHERLAAKYTSAEADVYIETLKPYVADGSRLTRSELLAFEEEILAHEETPALSGDIRAVRRARSPADTARSPEDTVFSARPDAEGAASNVASRFIDYEFNRKYEFSRPYPIDITTAGVTEEDWRWAPPNLESYSYALLGSTTTLRFGVATEPINFDVGSVFNATIDWSCGGRLFGNDARYTAEYKLQDWSGATRENIRSKTLASFSSSGEHAAENETTIQFTNRPSDGDYRLAVEIEQVATGLAGRGVTQPGVPVAGVDFGEFYRGFNTGGKIVLTRP